MQPRSHHTRPPWANYLSPHVSGDLPGLNTSSAAAVLLLEVAGRIFAITFGGGRHLIEPDSYVRDFGLKVVLNTVAPDQLKSVDAKTIDDTTVHSRLDLSHESSFGAFGLDVSHIDPVQQPHGWTKGNIIALDWIDSDGKGNINHVQFVVGTNDLPSGREPLIANHSSQGANYPHKRWQAVRERIELAHSSWGRFALAAQASRSALMRKSTLRPTSTDPVDCSMAKLTHARLLACFLSGVALLWTLVGCGDDADTVTVSASANDIGETRVLSW